MINDKILLCREQRSKKTVEFAKNASIITLKANVPGCEKNIPHAYLVVSYFVKLLVNKGANLLEWFFNEDGITVYFSCSNGEEYKKIACHLEESLPIGRLIDIDITLKGNTSSLARTTPRKCFLCSNPAFICGRNKTHTIGELLTHFATTTENYLQPIVANAVKTAMEKELSVENKFGLVTLPSNGSHLDMDAKLMQRAINEIYSLLPSAFFVGLKANNLNILMNKLIPIGLECEKAMLTATNQKNAYKGFIFAGGVLLASFGYALGKGLTYQEVSSTCAKICANLPIPTNTFGYNSYKNGFGGIRENAKNGFLSVFNAEKQLNTCSPQKILANIVCEIEDSVLLKRAGSLENYNYYKNLISTAKEENFENITNLCIKNNVSIGGSADVFICAIMMQELKKSFAFKE